MGDFTIRAEGLRPIERRLYKLLQRFGDLLPLMDQVGRYLVGSTRHRFETSTGPDGQRWSDSLRVKAEGGLTLVQSGQLRDSITHLPTPASVEIGTNKIYARVQQDGATITPVDAQQLSFQLPGVGLVHAMSVIIPARPFVGLSIPDERGVVRLTERYAEAA